MRRRNTRGTGGDLCDVDGLTRRVSPNSLVADLADASDGAGSLRERDDSARHVPGLLWELPRSTPSPLARDEATRGRSKDLSARGATTHPTRGADPVPSAASAQSATTLLGLGQRTVLPTSTSAIPSPRSWQRLGNSAMNPNLEYSRFGMRRSYREYQCGQPGVGTDRKDLSELELRLDSLSPPIGEPAIG